jgi:hypothetical protein
MKIRRLLGWLLLAGLVVYGSIAMRELRPFVQTKSMGTESCRLVQAEGLVGAEDMEFDHQTGTLYIAAAGRRSGTSFRPDPGAFFRWHPDDEAAPTKLPVQGVPQALRPHGLSLYIHPSGERRLFAVHHGISGEEVLIFRLEGEPAKPVLTLIRSVTTPLFVSLNDVAGAGLESFYVSNDHGHRSGLGHVYEDFTMRAQASVVYFDGTSARTVAGDLRYANGVQLSTDRKHLLVAETMGYRIKAFARDERGDLQLRSQTLLDTTPDNFSQDANGDYLIGAHPSPYLFLRHAASANNRAPSEVLRVRLSSDGTLSPATTILSDSGQLFSASSVAVTHGRHLLIGGVFDRGVLDCPAR